MKNIEKEAILLQSIIKILKKFINTGQLIITKELLDIGKDKIIQPQIIELKRKLMHEAMGDILIKEITNDEDKKRMQETFLAECIIIHPSELVKIALEIVSFVNDLYKIR